MVYRQVIYSIKKYVNDTVSYILHPPVFETSSYRDQLVYSVSVTSKHGDFSEKKFQNFKYINAVKDITLLPPLFNFVQNFSNLFRVIPPRSDATLLGTMKMRVKYCGLPDEYI